MTSELFDLGNIKYNLCLQTNFSLRVICTSNYGLISVRYFAAKNWNMIPIDIRNVKNLSDYTLKIKSCILDGCFCMLCCAYISPWAEPWKTGICLRWMDKTWYRYWIASRCLISKKVWSAVRISSFWWKIEVFYRPEWTKRETAWKWIFSINKFRNEYYKQLDRKTSMKKYSHLSSFHVSFLRYGS